jgi:hypothetical protein
MGAAAPNDRALNCRTAPMTRLASALIDIESLLHLAITIWCGVVVNRRATSGNSLTQHTNNRKVQRIELCWAKPVRRGKRMDLRAPERLIGVDVADAHDAALIKQKALDPCGTVRNE